MVSFLREPSRTSWKMWTFYRDLAVSDQVTLTNEGDVPKEKKLGAGIGRNRWLARNRSLEQNTGD